MHKITITKMELFPFRSLFTPCYFCSSLKMDLCTCAPLCWKIMRAYVLSLFQSEDRAPLLYCSATIMIHNSDELFHCPINAVTHSHPCSSLLIVDQKAHLQNLLQKSLNSRSSLALASGTLIQSVSAYSSKLRVSPENPNFGTIGGFRSFDLTPSQSIVLKKRCFFTS